MNRFRLLGFLIGTLSVATLGQVTITDPYLYRPVDSYNDCANASPASCYVDMVIPNPDYRTVPIRVRYPRTVPPGGKIPLIIWSHGGGENKIGREINEPWGRTLARAGYIVVHMSHFWSPELRTAACTEFAVQTVQECMDFPMGSLIRPRDASTVLGALDLIERSIPELDGRIDRNNIAVAGWSYGSLTALTIAGARLRFSDTFNDVSFANPLPKVFLALSPQAQADLGWKSDSWRLISRPVLFGYGAADVAGTDNYVSRGIPFQSVVPGNKFELFIRHLDAVHDTFNLTNENHPEFSQWLASYTLAYFDRYLKNVTLGGAFIASQRLPLRASKRVVRISRR